MVKIFNDDCMEKLKTIPNNFVDMVLCDLPYGTTDNEWDNVLPLNDLWKEYKRICKPNAAIVLFSQLPFLCDLINANRKWFRYEWIIQKSLPVGFLNAKLMPLRTHENILVFYQKLPTYNPQFTDGKPYKRTAAKNIGSNYHHHKSLGRESDGKRYPIDVLHIKTGNHYKKFHPTEKPIELCEYMIKTYTNENDVVLDNCMGSGSTGIACVNTHRNFIGMELSTGYFNIADKRILESILKRDGLKCRMQIV